MKFNVSAILLLMLFNPLFAGDQCCPKVQATKVPFIEVLEKPILPQEPEALLDSLENGAPGHHAVSKGFFHFLTSPIINHPILTSCTVLGGLVAYAYYKGYLNLDLESYCQEDGGNPSEK